MVFLIAYYGVLSLGVAIGAFFYSRKLCIDGGHYDSEWTIWCIKVAIVEGVAWPAIIIYSRVLVARKYGIRHILDRK